jgi:hypothetical protein
MRALQTIFGLVPSSWIRRAGIWRGRWRWLKAATD